MKGKPTKRKASRPRGGSRAGKRELKSLAALSDDRIATDDIPEVLDWSQARRGLFYRPLKRQLTLRVDADVVAWFKRRAENGRGYQTDINRALREHVRREEKRAAR